MSVSFHFHRPADSTDQGCDHRCPVDGGCDEQQTYFYCDHMHEAREACPECALVVNLANGNATSVLERLGFDCQDLFGSASADDFMGRVLVANVGRDDSGTSTVESQGTGGATMVECGQRDGYYDSVMGRLASLAAAAKARGFGITWG